MEIVVENATSLAWMGDAYMSLCVRKHLLNKGYQNANTLQKKSTKFCSAKGQAKILEQMLKDDFFTKDEKDIISRGRNATIHSKAKNADGKTYLQATALEAVLGYLYLYHHEDRLIQCMDEIIRLGDLL